MRLAAFISTALALSGCGRTPAPPAETRPQWQGAAVDGLAPLMAPRDVEAALTRHGYVQVPCASDDEVFDEPLYRGGEIPCYRSASRPMGVSLYFLELHEGRRLAVVNLREDYDSDASEAARLAASRAFAQQVRARLGPPFTASESPAFRSYYWRRPGGKQSLPDMVSTTVGADFPPNLTMTSFWAYGQQRPSR